MAEGRISESQAILALSVLRINILFREELSPLSQDQSSIDSVYAATILICSVTLNKKLIEEDLVLTLQRSNVTWLFHRDGQAFNYSVN